MINTEATARTVQKGSTAQQQSDARLGQLRRLEYLDEMRTILGDAETVAPDWLSMNDRRTILRDLGMNEADVYSVLFNRDLPHFHQQRVIDQIRRRPSMMRRVD